MSIIRTRRNDALLQALAANPDGLSTPQLAADWGGSASWHNKLVACGRMLNHHEAMGHVKRAGSVRGVHHNRPRVILWQITDKGRRFAETPSAALGELAILALAMLGHPCTAGEIAEWMTGDGVSMTTRQVYMALYFAGPRSEKPPLVERTTAPKRGQATYWRLTENGHKWLKQAECST